MESDIPEPVEGRQHASVDAVKTIKILPKPITFENKVQTDEFIDCPVNINLLIL